MTCVHSSLYHSNRHVIWENLYDILLEMVRPWNLTGDFNALNKNDKDGGRIMRNLNDYAFHEFFQNLGGNDLDFVGSKFSWDHG